MSAAVVAVDIWYVCTVLLAVAHCTQLSCVLYLFTHQSQISSHFHDVKKQSWLSSVRYHFDQPRVVIHCESRGMCYLSYLMSVVQAA